MNESCAQAHLTEKPFKIELVKDELDCLRCGGLYGGAVRFNSHTI